MDGAKHPAMTLARVQAHTCIHVQCLYSAAFRRDTGAAFVRRESLSGRGDSPRASRPCLGTGEAMKFWLHGGKRHDQRIYQTVRFDSTDLQYGLTVAGSPPSANPFPTHRPSHRSAKRLRCCRDKALCRHDTSGLQWQLVLSPYPPVARSNLAGTILASRRLEIAHDTILQITGHQHSTPIVRRRNLPFPFPMILWKLSQVLRPGTISARSHASSI
ncbi:hypothetical protein V8C26DRAFT_110849 [Trichoderma gracile]